MKFELGDKVTWTSQAAGRTKTKEGVIVAVVPVDVAPYRVMEEQSLLKNHSIRVDGRSLTRNDESYLVSVSGRTPKAMPVLYWPRVSALRRVGELPPTSGVVG